MFSSPILYCNGSRIPSILEIDRLSRLINLVKNCDITLYVAGEFTAEDFEICIPANVIFISAPQWLAPYKNSNLPNSLTEELVRQGWLSPIGLANMLNAWRSLFSIFKPQKILVENSLTALLAAKEIKAKTFSFDQDALEILMKSDNQFSEKEGQVHSALNAALAHESITFDTERVSEAIFGSGNISNLYPIEGMESSPNNILAIIDPMRPDLEGFISDLQQMDEVRFLINGGAKIRSVLGSKFPQLQEKLMRKPFIPKLLIGDGAYDQLHFAFLTNIPSIHMPFLYKHLHWLREFERVDKGVTWANVVTETDVKALIEITLNSFKAIAPKQLSFNHHDALLDLLRNQAQ